MGIFSKGLADPDRVPADPHAVLVDEVADAYPFGHEAIGIRALVRMIVFTVLELKKRGLI